MSRKAKFRPVITRVKLNPEQAVLACSCFSTGHVVGASHNAATLYAASVQACSSPGLRSYSGAVLTVGGAGQMTLGWGSVSSS